MNDFNITEAFAIEGIISNITASFLWAFAVGIISIIIFQLTLSKIKKNNVINQAYIFTNTDHILCSRKDNCKVSNISELLDQHRKKIHTTKDTQEVCFWNTRVSTFIVFTDGIKVVLYNRKQANNDKLIFNPKLDAHGAIAFNNESLQYKIGKLFDMPLLRMETIDGIAIEEVNKKVWNINIPYYKETVIMLGFVAYVDSLELLEGDDNNKISLIKCLSFDDNNLTSKMRLGIKHLKFKNFKS